MIFVICCGMPRSGSTLQFNIVANILQDNVRLLNLGWVDTINLTEIDYSYDYAIIKTHTLLHPVIHEIAGQKANRLIYFYSFRDLRDVVVSIMKMKKKNFELFIVKKWLREIIHDDNIIRKKNAKDIYVGKYEDFKKDLRFEISKASKFLSINLSESRINEIAQSLSLENMVSNMRLMGDDFDKATLIHKNHINSGEEGQWLRNLNRYQIGYIEYLSYDWLIGNGYLVQPNLYNSTLINSMSEKGNRIKRYLRKIFK